jgi:hypothetical protein
MEALTGEAEELAAAVERAARDLNLLIEGATGAGLCVSLRVEGGTRSRESSYYEVGRGLEDWREEEAPPLRVRVLASRVGLAGHPPP